MTCLCDIAAASNADRVKVRRVRLREAVTRSFRQKKSDLIVASADCERKKALLLVAVIGARIAAYTCQHSQQEQKFQHDA